MYQSLEDVYSQNFNSLPSSGTTFTWGDNSTVVGWYAANTGSSAFNPAGVTTGSTTTGNLYSFGSSAAADRALGSIGSGSSTAGGFYYGVKFINDTGVTINAVTISYVGEQWRSSAAAAQTVSFQYSLSATGIKTGTYTSVPALDFTSPVTGGTAGALNGNSTANRTIVGPITIIGLYWPPNTSLWIRWSDPDHSGSDHGLAIDDFSFQAAGGNAQYDPPAGYYDAANGLVGHDLEFALHNIISPHAIIPYNASGSTDTLAALKVLDEDPFDTTKVKLFYSLSSALKTDFGVSWNREHIWPKSRGIDDSGPDSSDLFNIRAADSAVNSARGNKIFADSDPLDPNYRMPAHVNAAPDTSADTDSWQPPADQRGDVARALFYMHVRYDGNTSVDSNTTDLTLGNAIINTSDMGILSTLLQWHRADAVSDDERHRNQLIYTQFQHNRNPFVDNPDFAEKLFNELEASLEDGDLDGMPNSWEQANNFDSSNAADASQDADGDGFTNFEEYWMGSDPHNSASPAVIVVNASYTGATENGSVGNPFKRIQSAIDVVPAAELRAIVVKPGVYNERPFSNGKTRIHLFSEAGATQTIIDGQQVNSSVVRLYGFDKASFSGFTVRNAQTDWLGAGLRVEAGSGVILIDSNVLTNNVSTSTSATGGGGGLYVKTARGSRITNNYITNNTARRGGGVLFAAGNVDFWHNTIVGNTATAGLGGGLSALTGVSPNVRNNIIWNNSGAGTDAQTHQLVVANNVLQGATAGSGNINVDPNLVSPIGGIYRIPPNSSARDKAVPVSLRMDFDCETRPETGLAKADMGADEIGTADADANGVPDYWELNYYGSLGHGSDDFDEDGLTNASEFQIGTNAASSDSDSDEMPDGWEVSNGLDPQHNDAHLDFDGDGIPNVEEFALGTSPASIDSDTDGMPDGWEVAHKLDPLSNDANQDKDGDGFNNLAEYTQGRNPESSDAFGVAAGEYHTVAVGSSGLVWSWGANSSGQLGDGSKVQRLRPTPVIGLRDVAAVSAGAYHTLAVKRDGTVWAWGQNALGQLGTNSYLDSAVPVQVVFHPNANQSAVHIVAVASGAYHNLALADDGTVYSWGLNSDGQLGDGSTSTRPQPTVVLGLGAGSGVKSIGAGAYHSVISTWAGSVKGWGANFYGGLGNGITPRFLSPVNVATGKYVKRVGAGAYHTMMIRSDESVEALGWNDYGQLGDGGTQARSYSGLVPVLGHIVALGASKAALGHCLALAADGGVWSWGADEFGELGSLAKEDQYVAIRIPGLTNIAKVTAGSFHSIAVSSDGAVYAWGYNAFGELGNGTNFEADRPIKLENFSLLPTVDDADQDNLADWWEYRYFGNLDQSGDDDTEINESGTVVGDGRVNLLEFQDGKDPTINDNPHIEALSFSSRLVNISTRASVGTGENVIIAGFIIAGNAPKRVLVRAIGPSLSAAGVSGALSDTVLELHKGDGSLAASNDDWRDLQEQQIAATTLAPTDDRESAIVVTLAPGQYTAVIAGKANQTGVALIEVYDLDTGSSYFANLSTRALLGTGENVVIAGFIISGSSPVKVAIRGIGPSLSARGIAGALQDPFLRLVNPNDASLSLAFNDDWKRAIYPNGILGDPTANAAQESAVKASQLPPEDERESTIITTLLPGQYTAILSGRANNTGVALIEVYDISARPATNQLDSDGDGLPDIIEAGPGPDFPSLPNLPAARTNFSGQIRVKAYIDRVDYLHIKDGQMWFTHPDNSNAGDFPGWWHNTVHATYPTMINGLAWLPSWSNFIDLGNFTKKGGISSTRAVTPQAYQVLPYDPPVYTALAVTTPPAFPPEFMDYQARMEPSGATTDLDGHGVSIRGAATLKQIPSSANGFETIIELNDDPFSGAQWMEFIFQWKSKFTFTNWKNDATHVKSDDTDGDGLKDGEEVLLWHTDPNNYDTNGDKLSDGLELKFGLDPLSPTLPPYINPATPIDINTFGLDPNATDSDHDGATDNVEIQQGSNPTDPSDHGQPPAPEDILLLRLTIGAGEDPQPTQEDDFQSYQLIVTQVDAQGRRSPFLTFPSNGSDGVNKAVRTFNQFRRDRAYEFEVRNQQPAASISKDFDYTAKVEVVGSGEPPLMIYDPKIEGTDKGVLGSHEQDQEQDKTFPQAGKHATLLAVVLNDTNAGAVGNSTQVKFRSSDTDNRPGNIAWIKPSSGGNQLPEMPRLRVSLVGGSADLSAAWLLENRYPRRGTRDNLNIPSSGLRALPGNTAWDIFAEYQTFFGGDCNIHVTITGADNVSVASDRQFKFRIRGINPDDTDCKSHIVQNQGPVWYGWAIAKHESSDSTGIYNEFANGLSDGSPGVHGGRGEPFHAASEGDGWGLFQRDTSSGFAVTTDETWNWDANMRGFLGNEYPQHLRIANNYIDGIRNANPNTFEEPQFTIEGVQISGRDMLALTSYNGLQLGGQPLSTRLRFDPNAPSGQRWIKNLPNAPGDENVPYVNLVLRAYNGG